MASHAATSAGSWAAGSGGNKKATSILKDGMEITVDGGKGIIYEGQAHAAQPRLPPHNCRASFYSKPVTATEIKVNVSEPDRRAAAATQADGGAAQDRAHDHRHGQDPNWYRTRRPKSTYQRWSMVSRLLLMSSIPARSGCAP